MREPKDLTNQRFGKLTAISPKEEKLVWRTEWICQCDCGNITVVPANNLLGGHTKSCGCLKGKHRMKDLTGERFGKLIALHPSEDRKWTYVVWQCQCDCGNLIKASSFELKNKIVQSCGCLPIDIQKARDNRTCLDGTYLDLLNKEKKRINNTTGHTGISKNRDKFHAYITFQSKRYNLGYFTSLEEAITARQKAEELFRTYVLECYEKWKSKSNQNSQWAKENPIKIHVDRDSNNDLTVTFTPEV